MESSTKASKGAGPALLLMLAAPLLAEILPGATRFSAIFVFPVEILVWGGGALMIRFAVRKWQLNWPNMLLLALALSVAEECIIQQTSLAPMVLQLKGITYARSLGINYVYLLWALVYESVFVVFLPVYLVEMIYPGRKNDLWLKKSGLVLVATLFVIGAFLAWFSWTQIARPKVFHVPAYNPSFIAVLISVLTIILLIFFAIGPYKKRLFSSPIIYKLPSSYLLFFASIILAILWYALAILAFGLYPDFPPIIAVASGLLLALLVLLFLPRWTENTAWNKKYSFAIIFGLMIGSMLAGYIGFIGATSIDIWFKIIVNILAFTLMLGLAKKLSYNWNEPS